LIREFSQLLNGLLNQIKWQPAVHRVKQPADAGGASGVWGFECGGRGSGAAVRCLNHQGGQGLIGFDDLAGLG